MLTEVSVVFTVKLVFEGGHVTELDASAEMPCRVTSLLLILDTRDTRLSRYFERLVDTISCMNVE